MPVVLVSGIDRIVAPVYGSLGNAEPVISPAAFMDLNRNIC